MAHEKFVVGLLAVSVLILVLFSFFLLILICCVLEFPHKVMSSGVIILHMCHQCQSN